MSECSVEFDEATQSGALVVRVRFERVLTAGHLDFQKPAAAIAEMKQAAPSIAADWGAILSEAMRGARA